MKTSIKNAFQALSRPLLLKLLLPASSLLFSFIPVDTNKSNAPVIRKELIIEDRFQSVSIIGNISVVLTNNPAGSVMIEGNENDVNKASYRIKNNELIIKTGKKKRTDRLVIYLSALTLKHMLINGNGLVSSGDLIKTDDLSIWLNGVINVDINVIGHVSVDAYDGYDLLWKSSSDKKAK